MRKLFIVCFVLFSVMIAQCQVMTERSDYNVGSIGLCSEINIVARVEVENGITTKWCVFKGSQDGVNLSAAIKQNELIGLIEKLQGMKEGDFNLNCNYFDKHYTIQLNNNGGVEVGFYIKEGYNLQWYLSISIDGKTITVNALYEKIYQNLLKAKTKLQTL